MEGPELVSFLKHLGIRHPEVKDTFINAPCPLARWRHKNGHDSHPSFGVSISKHRSFFNCFACNKGGGLEDLLAELTYYTTNDPTNDIDLASAYKLLEASKDVGYIKQPDWKMEDTLGPKKIISWPEDWLSSFMRAEFVPMAREYLTKRRVALQTIRDFDIRFDTFFMAVTFPVRDSQKRLVGMRGRYLDPKKEPRYKDYVWHDINNTSLVWFNEDKTTTSLPVVLVEGAFDLLAVWPHYRNVLSPLMASFSRDKLMRLESYPEVWCFFDNDVAGTHAYEKVLFALGKKIPVRRLEYPTNLKFKDPGELPESVLGDMLKHLTRLQSVSL